MSAFCVFGVTMDDCVNLARKKTKIKDRELKRLLTQEEWVAKCDKLAREMFENCVGSKQISPAFDAPQFAHDWIEVAKKTIESKSIRIMCRGKKVDDKGGDVIRKGQPVIGWVPYEK